MSQRSSEVTVDPEALRPRVRAGSADQPDGPPQSRVAERAMPEPREVDDLEALKQEVSDLRTQVRRLLDHLGLDE